MNYHIPEGQHHAWPPAIGLFYDKKVMERIVYFNITCKYELPIADQDDVNKLFGWGYFNGLHHTDSARFGWNYNRNTSHINLFAYCYVNGERIIKFLCEALTYRALLLSIRKSGNAYSFAVVDAHNTYFVYGSCDIEFTHKKKLGYKLGCFFGGNNPAPHEITIKMNRK